MMVPKSQLKMSTLYCVTISYQNTHTQPFYGSLDSVRDNPWSWYQKKCSPIHTYRGHQSSLICFLHRSILTKSMRRLS